MTKTRLNKGEKYYLVNTTLGTLSVDYLRDWRTSEDDAYYASGNYFHTEEEAEDMAKKLRTVLNGADVIEMPSTKEVDNIVWDHAHKGGYAYDSCYPIFRDGWNACYGCLKSKIVK